MSSQLTEDTCCPHIVPSVLMCTEEDVVWSWKSRHAFRVGRVVLQMRRRIAGLPSVPARCCGRGSPDS